MIDTQFRTTFRSDTIDGQTPAGAGGGTRPGTPGQGRRPKGRLWALLHAQALLSGPATDGIGIEDDWQRMAGRQAR